jgi:hypothetical protein
MQDNFDLKKFLVENKLTPASQMSEITAKGKKVKTYKQNGDKSYSVEFEDGTKDTIAVSHDDWEAINDDNLKKNEEDLDEYFSFDNKSPEGQRIKNKPQDVLNRRGQGQITPDNKDIYKKVVGKKGDVGKAYGNVGPKGSLPENGSAFSKY